MTSSALVLVGAMNWDHPHWRGSFYPESLPDDWLLSYYNTQFQAVYLPAAVWQTASDADWAQWLQDTQDGFCFVLEPGGAAAEAWQRGHARSQSDAAGQSAIWQCAHQNEVQA